MKLTKAKLVCATFVLFLVAFAQVGWGMESALSKEASLPSTLSSLAPEAVSTEQDIQTMLPAGWPSKGLHVFPDAGRQAWLDAINSAKESIQMAAYKLSDETIVSAIISVIKKKQIKVYPSQ